MRAERSMVICRVVGCAKIVHLSTNSWSLILLTSRVSSSNLGHGFERSLNPSLCE